MTRQEFVTACSGPLEAAYSRMDPATIEMYYSFLKDMDVQLLATSVAKLICETKWCPKIAEIRSAAIDIVRGQFSELTVGEAWAIAHRAVCKIDLDIDGSLARALRDVPEPVRAAMRSVGINRLINATGEFQQRESRKWFEDAYSGIVARQKKEALATPDIKKAISANRLPALAASALSRIGMEDTHGKDKPDAANPQMAQGHGLDCGRDGAMVSFQPPPY